MPKSISLILLALVLTCACVKQVTQPDQESLPSQVQSIIVLPVLISTDPATNPPPSSLQLRDGAAALTKILQEYFADNSKIRVLSVEELESFKTEYNATPSAQAQFIGQSLKTEAVMLWELQRYSERRGSDYAIQSPASLAFTYRLLHAESGQTLCAGSFDETQQSATENLLSLKKIANRGFKWITASDLAQEGVAKKLPACTYLQETK